MEEQFAEYHNIVLVISSELIFTLMWIYNLWKNNSYSGRKALTCCCVKISTLKNVLLLQLLLVGYTNALKFL